jgi:hypothetical protein
MAEISTGIPPKNKAGAEETKKKTALFVTCFGYLGYKFQSTLPREELEDLNLRPLDRYYSSPIFFRK